MRRKLVAGFLGVLVGGVTLALGSPAEASGVTTHSWMAVSAVSRVSDPQLRALLQANVRHLEGGAHFPDSGYANPLLNTGHTYGEETHWPRFSNAYIDQIADDPRCTRLRQPNGPCAARIAHAMGAVAHGIGDEVWDWLFEPNAPDLGESYIPPALAGSFSVDGLELQMDMIAIEDYGRPTSPDLPQWPNRSRIIGVLASIGRDDVTTTDLRNGEHSMRIVRAGERLLTAQYHDLITANMPWTSAHLITAPGGIRYASKAIAAAYENLWGRLLGNTPPTEVAVTYPAAGQQEIPSTGWTRSSFQPGSNPSRGGAATRITATLSASLPYRPRVDTPGTVPSELPPGAMTLTEEASGEPVPLRSGYPRIVPYSPEAGEHTIDIQPDGDLDPCTDYRVAVTDALIDGDGAPVVPYSWTFRTDGCSGTVARPDTRVRRSNTGAWVGWDVFTADGAGQRRSATIARGTSAEFGLWFANTGNTPDTFTILGQPATPGFRVRYFDGATDVTAAVTSGTHQTGLLAPGASDRLRVTVTVQATAANGASTTRLVTARSAVDEAAVDTAQVTVKQGAAEVAAESSPPAAEINAETLDAMASILVCTLA